MNILRRSSRRRAEINIVPLVDVLTSLIFFNRSVIYLLIFCYIIKRLNITLVNLIVINILQLGCIISTRVISAHFCLNLSRKHYSRICKCFICNQKANRCD